MSRFNPAHETAPIYALVETWRDRCLLGDEALLAEGVLLRAARGFFPSQSLLSLRGRQHGDGDSDVDREVLQPLRPGETMPMSGA